ncbi:MAG TPA: GLPGLI family protein [Edaphocola sp.]|nr:GLPGLI family protein [Edaphocola sp.]
MNKFLIIFSIVFSLSKIGSAQFRSKGSIEFTRSVNQKLNFQLEADEDFKKNSFYKEILKQLSTNAESYFKMDYNKVQTVYFFDKDGETKSKMNFGGKIAEENTVIQNFKSNQITAQKAVFEKDLIIQDSIPQYLWKIHDEQRTIAGYPCRKATTIINDSVVVVAFYTDQIMVSSGPESFGGLPGMILGLAIPRLYTTWFATKVNDVELPESQIKKIKKGKAVTYSEMNKDLESRLKEWGKHGQAILWKCTL